MKPVVKWVGGKSQLIDEIVPRLPRNFNRYLEPFLGGASVLLSIAPDIALVNDLNSELINMYKVVKNYPNSLMEKLDVHENKLSENYYYFIRGLDRDIGLKNLNHIYRASRFIFLNKSGFNGLYRVNSEGYMNVPFGKKETVNTYSRDNILQVSNYFNENNLSFFNKDYFVFLLENVKEGDFVYLDPPYDPISETSSFSAYQKTGFTREDQIQLRDACLMIHNRGAYFMLSNSKTDFIEKIYDVDGFTINYVNARRSINSNGKLRGEVQEVLITNY